MKRQTILASLLLLFAQPFFVNASQSHILNKRFVLGVDVGTTLKAHLIQDHKFPLGYSTFIYTPDRNSSTRYGVSLGRRFALNSLNSIILGLAYHRFSSIAVNGTLQQGISPPFYSANYQYTLQLSQLLAEARLQHEWRQLLYPYVSAGAGVGFNHAKQFRTTVPEYLTVTPTFTNHTNSSFSYMLGLGMDVAVFPQATLGVGYVFSDLGQVGLGNGAVRATTVRNYLSQSHLYTNTIVAQFNWYF